MTTEAHHVASSHRGGRAHKPGPRKVYLGAALIAIGIAVVAVLAISSTGGSSHSSASVLHHKIVLPALPKQTVLAATAQKPQLSSMEGTPVDAQLASGSSQLFVAGPSVPSWVATQASEGKLVTGSTVPSTFTVSFSQTRGTVPLSADQFTIIDYKGTIVHPKVTTASGGALPANLPAGTTVSLKLTAPVTEGDGAIRWAPDAKHIVVSYFWTLEFD
jgi:hypothetical protein